MSDVGRLEAVKWLAFLAMVADHVGLVVYDGELAWLHAVGRFAFPAFALCFGLGLAHSADPARIARRLVLPALLAQVAWQIIDPGHRINVLGMFAGVAALVWLWRGSPLLALFAFAPFMAAFGILEGGPLGVLLTLAGVLAGRWRSRWLVAPAGALWLLGGFTPGAVLGLAAPMVWPRGIPVPRHRGLLMWAYPAHLAVLAAAKGIMG